MQPGFVRVVTPGLLYSPLYKSGGQRTSLYYDVAFVVSNVFAPNMLIM